jgi:hypothetical protein
MSEQNVVTFPKGRRQSKSVAKTGDEKLVANIRAAWRRLALTIEKARNAGLTVDTDFWASRAPTITRKL